MKETQRIADQLRRSLDGDAWHGPSLMTLLEDVEPERAAAAPAAGVHSIWELVQHVAVWQAAARNGLAGESLRPQEVQDWPVVPEPTPEEWRATLADLRTSNDDLCDAVTQLTDQDLENPVSEGKYTVYMLLHGVVQHNLYHAGQIAILRRP